MGNHYADFLRITEEIEDIYERDQTVAYALNTILHGATAEQALLLALRLVVEEKEDIIAMATAAADVYPLTVSPN